MSGGRETLVDERTWLIKDGNVQYAVVGGETRRARKNRNLILAGIAAVALFVIILTVGLVIGLAEDDDDGKGSVQKMISCKQKKDVYPLLILSMDGFKPHYLSYKKTPNVQKLIDHGVLADFMVSQFPTKTFPNHYSIVTGLYPESHGIVSNTFYDRNFSERFRLGGPAMYEAKWWWGEPIWLTVMKAGLSAATYFWPGSEAPIGGLKPNHTMKYNRNTPYSERVSTVLEWLKEPEKTRPTFLTLYFEEPDSTGHKFGPSLTPEMEASLERVDNAVGQLVEGLQNMDLLNCINLLLVSDHGMAAMDCSRVEYTDKYNVTNDDIRWVDLGAFMSMSPRNRSEANSKKIVEKLQCAKHMSAFRKQEMPKRLHYSNNRRIEDIIAMPEVQWVGGINSTAGTPAKYCTGGTHGYDNKVKDMWSLFIAHGPSFKEGFKTEHFSNIEIYNLMAGLFKLKPAPNNGTSGSLNHILWDEESVKVLPPPAVKNMLRTDICKFPKDYKGCTSCICPYCDNGVKTNITKFDINQLDIPDSEAVVIKNKHFPWGLPKGGAGDGGCLLLQRHFLTGYSFVLHIPLWVGHMLLGKDASKSVPRKNCFRTDPRLVGDMASNCSNYQYSGYDRGHMIAKADIDMTHTTAQSTFLLSNIAPQDPKFNQFIWAKLEYLVRMWAEKYHKVYVISGSIFDSDSDGLRDPDKMEKSWLKNETGKVPIPTHFYKIITRCNTGRTGDYKARGCDGKLEVLSFVLPNHDKPCKFPSNTDYLKEHLSPVRDVELLTGTQFFPDLSLPHQAQLKTFMPMELWPY